MKIKIDFENLSTDKGFIEYTLKTAQTLGLSYRQIDESYQYIFSGSLKGLRQFLNNTFEQSEVEEMALTSLEVKEDD